jgi:hypothetical protein
MNFKDFLSKEQQKEILTQKLFQLYVDGYQIALNLRVAKKTNNADLIKEASGAIQTVEAAIEVYSEELSTINN